MQKYEKPEFELVKFEVENIITASSTLPGLGEDELPPVDLFSTPTGNITD